MVLSVADFAKKIRKESWAYQGVDDLTLTKAVLKQRPEYSSQVKIPKEYTGWTMFSKKAVDAVGSFESWVANKFSKWFEQGKQQAKWYQKMVEAPAPTAEQVGIRRAPSQVKDKISSFFKTSGNRDVQIFWELAWDVGKAAQMTTNFLGWWARDAVTWLWNIRKQISSEGYGKTAGDIVAWVKEAVPQAIDVASQAFQWDKWAQNKIMQFIEKYPDIAIFWGKWAIDLAKWARNTAKFAKTMYDNPSFNVIDEAGNVAGQTTAREAVAQNFRTAWKTLFGRKKPIEQPTTGFGGTQAQGRRWRPDSEPPQPAAWPIWTDPLPFDPDWAGSVFESPVWKFQDFDNTFRGGVSSTMNKIWDTIGKWVNKITTPVAEIITKNKTGSQKIFSAVAPRYNKLQGRNTNAIAKMKNQIDTVAAVAMQLNMRPKSLSEFIDSTNDIISIMGDKVQEKLGRPIEIDMEYIASKIDEYIAEKSKSWIVTDTPGLNKLREQADAFREMGVIDVAQANTIKQELNTRASRDDPDLSQVTKNGYTTASVALGDALSTLLSDLPGEFRYYKETMGAGLAIMDDLMKSLTQEMKKSTNGIVESFSRISWLQDMLWGIISLSPSKTFSGLWTFIVWESYGKLKNKDFLIDRWFAQLYKEAWLPEPKTPYTPRRSDFAWKWESWITDQQIMKDFAGGKRYNEFMGAKQAEADAKAKQENDMKAQQEKIEKRAKEQQDMKKQKIETQKRRFEAALKSGIYEEIQPMKTPLKEGDLTEFYGEVTKRYTDRSLQKVDTEDADNLGIYEVGKVARKKWGNIEAEAPITTPNGSDDTPAPAGDTVGGEVKVKWYKQAEYKKAAEDMLWVTIEELPEEWQSLFQKAINAKTTKNRLSLVDELLFNYGTVDAKSAYLLDIADNWSKQDVQDAIDNLTKYWFWKENPYTPDEHAYTIAYLKDLLEKKTMEKPSLFDFSKDDWTTTNWSSQEWVWGALEVRTDKKVTSTDTTPISSKDGPSRDNELSNWNGKSDIWGVKEKYWIVEQRQMTFGWSWDWTVSVWGGKPDGWWIEKEQLMIEARKYKSADEFMKKTTVTVHGDLLKVWDEIKIYTGNNKEWYYIWKVKSLNPDKHEFRKIDWLWTDFEIEVIWNDGKKYIDKLLSWTAYIQEINWKKVKSWRLWKDITLSDLRKIREEANWDSIIPPENKSLSKAKKDTIQKTAIDILEKKNYSMDIADYTNDEIQTFKTYSWVSWITTEAGVLDQFYTPSTVIKAMRNLVGKYHDWPVQLALEPAAGIGRIALVWPDDIKFDMFEIDKTAWTIAQILNQNSNVTIWDFQDLFMDGRKPKNYQGKYYDVAISNPPYKTRQTKQRGLGELQEFDRFEDYFTYRQLQMVKPWWVVVTIVPSAFLNKWSYKAKEMIASIGKLVDAYRLPEGTFPDTQIWTDILVFKKETGDINDLIDKNFFKNNPAKILWEEKPATDRFWKPIMKVVGEKNAVTKIEGEFPKTISRWTSTPTITKPQQWLFAQATANDAKIKKLDASKPILAKDNEVFETKTVIMGNQDPKILQYQKDVNVLWHLNTYNIDDIASDPSWLNYMSWRIYTNYHYLQGNIREKLDTLEKDMVGGKIDKDIYDRQKSKLKAILPESVWMSDIMFSPFDQAIVNMPTGETKSWYSYEDGKQVKVELPITIRDLFMRWLRDNKPTSIESDNYQISRILDGKVAKWDSAIKYQIQIDAQKAFNDFMVEALPSRLQEKILLDYNYSYNSYVKPDNKSQPLVVNEVSVKFKTWRDFKFTDAQIEWINHLTNKWAWLIAYGVWVGKTITGLWATIVAMQKWWTKRPLFVVPKATLQHTWVGTIKKLFPTYNIVNLWWLWVPDIARLKKQYWPDPANWIKDWEIAITTFQGLKNITLKPENEQLVTKDLSDVMWNTTGNAKKDQKKMEKIEMEAGKQLKTTNSEIYLEDLWIDHLTIDEVHNMKNIFQAAEVKKEDGQFNPFWAVLKWSSSDLWRKAYMIAQHIMRNNNDRWVYALSATPFNNQPIEVYNLLALMAKKRLEDMGIKNINDFFTTFSYIQEEEVISPKDFNTVEYRPTMKSFSNVQELQKLLTEFIDYKDAASTSTMMPRPDKVVARHIVKNSPKQELVNQRIREWTDANYNKKWVYLVGMGQSILNATSPYFVNPWYSWLSPAMNWKQLFDASPKLQMALSMTQATLDSGKGHIFWFLEQWVDYHPMIVEYIQESLWLKKGEVAFISWKISQDKKDDIAEWFRQGKVKVLVGWTTTSEGIDLQDYWVTTLFFSLNWNPTKTVQAWWRIRRPGNVRDKVYEAYLLSEDSGDLRLMQKYEEKASRINDIFSYQGRVFEDESMTDWQAKMALMTDPVAKARQQMEMDKGEIVKKSKRMFDLTERNTTKMKVLNEQTRTITNLQDTIKYYEDLAKNWTIRDYQKDQLEDYKKDIVRAKNKVNEIIKKHDKDYSWLPIDEAAEKIVIDLNEKNKKLFEEKNSMDDQAKNIEDKLPEYEKYFFEEKKIIDALKKTPAEQIEEYKKFLSSVTLPDGK
jgi:superfamily II DNA or RNA helicase